MKLVLKKYGNTHVFVINKAIREAYGIKGAGSIVEVLFPSVDNSRVKEVDLEDEE